MSKNHALSATDAVEVSLAAEVADVMQALSTRSRVQILGRLAAEPCTVTELVDALGMEQPAISHQLRTLRLLHLVVSERRGRNVVYSLHDSHVAELLSHAVAHAEHRRVGNAAHISGAQGVAA